MHELGIANSIFEATLCEAGLHRCMRPTQVTVRIGELTAVDPGALQFCFNALTRDTEFAKLKLKIEVCPRKHRCSACGTEFIVNGYDFRCRRCGEEKTDFVSGDQLELASLEMEQYESVTA